MVTYIWQNDLVTWSGLLRCWPWGQLLQSPGRLPAGCRLWVPGQPLLHPGPLQQRDQHTLAHQVNHLSIFGFFKILYRVPTGKTIELTFTKFDVRHLSYLSFKFERILYIFFFFKDWELLRSLNAGLGTVLHWIRREAEREFGCSGNDESSASN